MRLTRARSMPWLTFVAFLPAMFLLPSLGAAAAKPAAKAAKPAAKAAKPAAAKPAAAKPSSPASAEASSAKSSSSAYEVPSPAPSPAPPTSPPSSSTETGAKSPTPPATESASAPSSASAPPAEAPKEPLPDSSGGSASVPEMPLPAADEIPVPAEPVPLYVEHLGPSSYPGRLRGLYGGSMWLEPSFHGLQWPYMAKTGVGVSGSFWVDSGYEQIKRENAQLPNTSMWLQQGRAVLRVTPTYTSGSFFIQGQVEVVGNQCQAASNVCTQSGTVDTDDLWIRVGQWNAWDLKVGRFEGWELYHTGMGLDINTLERQGAQQKGFTTPGDLQAPDYYGTNWLHDRPSAGLGVGYIAFHAYPTERFRFELLGELGADDTTNQGYTYLGGRPSVILDQGWLKLKFGAEYEKRTGDTQNIDANLGKQDSKLSRTRQGVGGTVQFVIDPRAEFGLNLAYGKQHNVPLTTGVASALDSFTRNSVGAFANLRVAALWLLGAGANFTWQNDNNYTNGSVSPDYTAHVQLFGALQYLLARQLYIKAVVGYARADFVTSEPSIPLWSNYMMSGRIRLMYLY